MRYVHDRPSKPTTNLIEFRINSGKGPVVHCVWWMRFCFIRIHNSGILPIKGTDSWEW